MFSEIQLAQSAPAAGTIQRQIDYASPKPGGRFLFSVWDRIEANEFADAVVKAVAALFPTDPEDRPVGDDAILALV
jgi:hypothetical protein